jgi:hypothetical protein
MCSSHRSRFDDPYGNRTENTSTTPVLEDMAITEQRTVSPDGTGALTFAPEQSSTFATFTLTRAFGLTQGFQMTATLDGTN